jgi:hypothetical protein
LKSIKSVLISALLLVFLPVAANLAASDTGNLDSVQEESLHEPKFDPKKKVRDARRENSPKKTDSLKQAREARRENSPKKSDSLKQAREAKKDNAARRAQKAKEAKETRKAAPVQRENAPPELESGD